MNQRKLTQRTFVVGVSAAAALLAAATVDAKESKRALCTAAIGTYKEAVASQKGGHLREAHDQFESCAEVTACAGLAPKCRAAADKIAAQMPSVVPVVTDAAGNAMVDVEVKMDGQALTSHLDGRGLPVEAGSHEFTFATGGHVIATQKVMVIEGERNRKIDVSLATATAPPARAAAPPAVVPPPEPEKTTTDQGHDEQAHEEAAHSEHAVRTTEGGWAMPSSPLPYILGGLGAAAVGGGVLFTVWGNKDNDQAVSSCHGTCPQSTADHIKTLYTLADISYGVGIAGLGLATIMIARSHSTEGPPAPKASATFDVAPTRAGAFASVHGSF